MKEAKNSGERLAELCASRLSGCRLILVSNRGPVEYHIDIEGKTHHRRGSGGVVTALEGLSQHVELAWIASAMGEGDRKTASQASGGRFCGPEEGRNLALRFVTNPRKVYHKYYSVFCNPLLWFLQHYMWNLARTPNIDSTIYDAWENGYVPVNEAFAQTVVEEASQSGLPPLILLNDYHLYLVGALVKKKLPDVPIQHFIHIPWPPPRYWQVLPRFMVLAIMGGLCAVDIIGLQTSQDVQNFLFCCQRLGGDVEVDYKKQTVTKKGHITQVKAYPVSVDVPALKATAATSEFKQYQKQLEPLCGQQNIVRVDRAEPSKNIIRGFRAFDILLERYPQFIGKLNFLAFMVPSRSHLKPYQRYTQDTFQLVEEINAKYGQKDWQPIKVFYENNYIQALAGMSLADVLVVNAVIDGMNLIAKEGPILNERDGVLMLSETVGAHEQLGEHVVSVAPGDIEGTARSMYQALTMPLQEKKRRQAALKKSIQKEDLVNWLCRLLEDLTSLGQPLPPAI